MSPVARGSIVIAPAGARAPDEQVSPSSPHAAERVRSLVVEHYASLWRFLRRVGVPEADGEDAAQRCLWIVTQRIGDVAPGKEKSFLFGVALRVAKATRRESRADTDSDPDRLAGLPSVDPDPGEQLDERRARALLDVILASLPLDLRTVFVLYELEELTMVEIARALEIPMGTVASRLRRARETFEDLSRRARRDVLPKGGPR